MIVYVGQTSAHKGTSGTSHAISYSPTAGNFVAVSIVLANSNNDQVTSVTDDQGSTYAASFNVPSVYAHFTCALFYCAAVAAGVTTITVNFPTSARCTVIITEFSGIAASPADQVSAENNDLASSTQTSPAVNTTQADELLLGYVYNSYDTAAYTAGAGFTIFNQADTTDGENLGTQYKIVSSTGSYASNTTTAHAVHSASWIATFKAATGGAPAALEAAISGTGTVAGALTTAIRMAAAITGAGTVVGELTTSIRMAASVTGAGTVVGELTTVAHFAASIFGIATATLDSSGVGRKHGGRKRRVIRRVRQWTGR